MVKLLFLIGESLGREEATKKLGPTLQLFFASFSGVHSNTSSPNKADKSADTDASTTASTEGDATSSPFSLKSRSSATHPQPKMVDFHPLTTSSSVDGLTPQEKQSDPNSEIFKQLCSTFSKSMAHSSYVDFCKLLGQYNLRGCLFDVDLIENLVYSHDEVAQPNSPLTSVFTDSISLESDSGSDIDSLEDSDDDAVVARDAALKVGPVVAVTGLSMDESGFRKSSWFVDLDEEEPEENTGTAGIKEVSTK